MCGPWWVGPQRPQGGRHGIGVCVVGATALQGVRICPGWGRRRAPMMLLLLLLLVVVVMCRDWWVGSGLASS